MQILVVEDDIRLADALATILRNNDYQVDVVNDGEEGLYYAQSGIYDCIVLDVMLPHKDGFEISQQLRREKNPVPILMLTARSAIADKVGGLDSGADDYMTKPFAPVELLARIRSLTRRQGDVVFESLEFGNVKLDLDTCELSCGAKSIRLSQKEFAIMKILLANPSRVTSKETLITKVWGYDSSAEDNNVEAYISFLRKKLDFVGSSVHIETLRKLGYRLRDDNGEDA
ncbi:response regulator transcription factor [Denitrobacterium detoxificans]|jgi:DNA-binding response OmpR family regulator|uniref:response regulator transcription factor n=1 Tax=Denitrobacterium detoxificans TaxID=79604 RepID=UPI0026F01423|nr:response regulator transcription factor [Denitrobacterium detoxificans]MBE6466555.1 response regulator transcription factor [Denitrobacterium detoxificans]